MNLKKTLLAAAILAASTGAHAAAILTLDDLNDGVAAVVINDDGAGDNTNTIDGLINSVFSNGNWNFAVVTGASDGTGTHAEQVAGNGFMDLSYIMSGSGAFQATFSDDITLSDLDAELLLDGNYSLAGNGSATVAASVYEDGSLVGSASEILNGAIGTYNLSNAFDFSNLNSNVSIVLNFSTDAGVSLATTSGDLLVSVPEPASVALLGVGVIGLGMCRRKQSQA